MKPIASRPRSGVEEWRVDLRRSLALETPAHSRAAGSGAWFIEFVCKCVWANGCGCERVCPSILSGLVGAGD